MDSVKDAYLCHMPKLKHFQNRDGGMVYSTNPDYMREMESETNPQPESGKQDLRIHLLRLKGNKVATVVRGHQGTDLEIETLGKTLKQKCGSGGSAKDGEIIIQGDHRQTVMSVLTQAGHRCKLAGG